MIDRPHALVAEGRILIVDDDPGAARVLAHVLKDVARIQLTTNADEALGLVRSGNPDVVLLDIEMPGTDGFTVCEQIKQHPDTQDVVVLFVTNHAEEDIETRALNAGAMDFIHKPVQRDIVRARVSNYLAMKQQADALRRLTNVDSLTGVANRRALDAALRLECARADRSKEPLAVLMCDVDHFKRYNDHYGHAAGDACLQRVATLLAAHARRPGDFVARYGGEEFTLVLPGCSRDEARGVGEAILAQMAAVRLPHAASPTADYVTLSIGVSVGESVGESVGMSVTPSPLPPASSGDVVPLRPDALDDRDASARLLARADAALYVAKHRGRNCVRVALDAGGRTRRGADSEATSAA